MTLMNGQRIEYDGVGIPDPGTYWKRNYAWYGMTPTGRMANLTNHEVVEHDDGTITVSPSILVSNNDESWHGYLERGVWREV